jgi:polyhydroxyalkanoate synthesis regulator phasin
MNPEQPQDPIFIIEGLRQQIYMLGANDSENSQINVIIEMYKKGEVTGEEAIQRVNQILHSKQDYH